MSAGVHPCTRSTGLGALIPNTFATLLTATAHTLTLKVDEFTAINMLVVRSREIAPSIWHKGGINAPAPSHACSLSKLAF